MPLYICAAEKGAIPAESKGLIAKEVTRVHCEITGAPPSFVHCFFLDKGDTQFSLLGHVFDSSIQTPIVLFGNLRAGRSEETKDRVVDDMCAGVASILGVPRDQIDMATQDIPAKWVVEGGGWKSPPGAGGRSLLAQNTRREDRPRK